MHATRRRACEQSLDDQMQLFGHPAGIYLVAFAQCWERFSFYGIMGLLALYLTAGTDTGGLDWPASSALKLVGAYGAAAFIAPAFGGWVASRFWGDQRCIRVGSLLVIAGHVLLSVQALPAMRGVAQNALFLSALGLIAAGTGLLKPATASIVGRCYAPSDTRREQGYVIFMVGIYSGSFLANLVAGTLGEKLGWHYGFGAAAIGMTVGFGVYILFARRLLGPIGAIADHISAARQVEDATTVHATARIIGFSLLTVFYTACFFQDAGMLNLLVERSAQRVLFGFEVPATWLLSVSTLAFMTLAPLMSPLQARFKLDVHGQQTLALVLMSAAYAILWLGSASLDGGGKMSLGWFIAAYSLFGLADLHIWPVQLSTVARLAPKSRTSLYVGLWWVAAGVGIFLTGYIAAFAAILGGVANLLLAIAATALAAALVSMLLGRMFPSPESSQRS